MNNDDLFAPLEPHALGTGVWGRARGPSPGSTGPLVRLERHVGQQDRRSDHSVSTAETGPYAAESSYYVRPWVSRGVNGSRRSRQQTFSLQGTRPS